VDSAQAKEQARLAALYELEILDSAPEPDFNDVVALAAHDDRPATLVARADKAMYRAKRRRPSAQLTPTGSWTGE